MKNNVNQEGPKNYAVFWEVTPTLNDSVAQNIV